MNNSQKFMVAAMVAVFLGAIRAEMAFLSFALWAMLMAFESRHD